MYTHIFDFNYQIWEGKVPCSSLIVQILLAVSKRCTSALGYTNLSRVNNPANFIAACQTMHKQEIQIYIPWDTNFYFPFLMYAYIATPSI